MKRANHDLLSTNNKNSVYNQDIKAFVEKIKRGELVAFPTETVYGLGADAWNPEAIRKIFDTKGRPADNPLIVHISDLEMVREFASEIPEVSKPLMENFWPGPMTLVFKKKPNVLDAITAGLDTVAIRMPDHSLALNFISKTGPLVAPSANRSGKPSPTRVEHVKADLGDNFPVLDGGECTIGLESTVIDVTEDPLKIYRPGYINRKDITRVTGHKIGIQALAIGNDSKAPKSPGQKYSHYTPSARVLWLTSPEVADTTETLYLLHSDAFPSSQMKGTVINYEGNFNRLAKELYDRFRQADIEGYRLVVIEPFDRQSLKEHPILDALLNRITKAIK